MVSDEDHSAPRPTGDDKVEDLRSTMEPAARRLDLAWERLNFALYGPEGKPDLRKKYEELLAIPGLTPAERMAMFMDPGEKKPDSPDLPEAQEEYREARDAFYTPEFFAQVERLRRGDQIAIECAIVYMEIDPWHFHSGYIKQKLARRLRHVPLSETQEERLRIAILAALPKGQRRDLSVRQPGPRDRFAVIPSGT